MTPRKPAVTKKTRATLASVKPGPSPEHTVTAVSEKPTPKLAGVSSEAVLKATGKGWDDWFAILDEAGAAQWEHPKIARYIHAEYGCNGWWSQMVTVGYEQARGMRVKHEKREGFEVSRSKTISTSAERLFHAWNDPKLRFRWLGPDARAVVVRKATPYKTLRVTWTDGSSSVDVMIYPKEGDKAQLVVQHGKLRDAASAERMKDYWAEAIKRLQQVLVSGK